MSDTNKGSSFNFDSFLGSVVNSVMDSVSARMYSINSTYVSPVVGGKVTNSNQDLSKMFNLDPDVFFEFLNDYSFLNALVKAYKDPLAEIIEGDDFDVKLDGGNLARVANEGIQAVSLKKFILDHLADFIKRGTYSGFLSVDQVDPDTHEKNTSITDSVHPYKNIFFERHGKFLKLEMNKVKFKFFEVFIYFFEKKTLNTYSKFETKEAMRQKDREKDFSGIITNKRFSPKTPEGPEIKPPDMTKEEWETKKAKEKLSSDIIQFRGKSIFEPFLRDLFHLFLLEYIYGQIALTEYMKSIMLKVTASGKADVAKLTEVANKIENLMNTDNANIICSFQDPNVMVSQIQDKLINRFRVLPELNDYSMLDELRVPQINERIEMLKQDIQTRKNSLTNSLSIPQEFLNEGQANSNYRWDIIARNQHFSDSLVQFLGTVAYAVKQFCTSYVFAKTGKYVPVDDWKFRFNYESYLYSFMQKSRMMILTERVNEAAQLIQLVDQVTQLPIVNRNILIEYVNKELNKVDPRLAQCINLTTETAGSGGGGGDGGGQQPEEGNGQGFSRAVLPRPYVSLL